MQGSAQQAVPAVRDVVLVGGGHSHVQVLKAWGMQPQPGVRLTLVSRDLDTPYSGMLPGCISGVYSADDIHIKLAPLCQFANARLISAEVNGIDLDEQRLHLAGRPPLRFDLLSINSGAVPVPPQPDAVTVKPISQFLPKWREIKSTIQPGQTLVIIGGGAGGVELAMSAKAVLPDGVHITLIAPQLLPGHGDRAIQRLVQRLHTLGVTWLESRAERELSGQVELDDERLVEADFVLWVTEVCAPDWIRDAGLQTDERGFLTVDQYLRSVSHANVFAAGDVAHLQGQERAKSGVYAVRAGPVLAVNLRRAVSEQPLQPFRAQRQHLALIGDGHGQAIASRGKWSAEGAFWWFIKDKIDRAFMRKFNNLPKMTVEAPRVAANLRADMPDQLMRCGGCGAKLAADPLRRVLARLPEQRSARVLLGIGDDAAMVNNEANATLMTIDGFRAMVDDPYLFGRITAHHSLNDVLAMAARPTAAMVFATVPLMAEALMEEELYQLLAGAVDVLNAHEVPLVGGHSAEGAELSIALTVTGEPGVHTLTKAGAKPGDHLILSKPLGTGVVLAAAMQGFVRPESLAAVHASMDLSNAAALEVMLCAGASALTDVTGFGLAGHLGEMLRASGSGVRVQLSQVPLLPEAGELLYLAQSSLQQANELALQDFEVHGGIRLDNPALRALADPQTSGGLLAAIPAERAQVCLQKLMDRGYAAADIGEIAPSGAWIIQ